MRAKEKTFVLGLGAQKAGTSWLYAYLNSDQTADFGALKEYHVWDALEVPGMEHFDVRTSRPVNRTLMRLKSGLTRAPAETWRLRGQMQASPEDYFSYFESLLNAPGIALTGDITPAYAGVPAATLGRIRDGFEKRGIAVRPVFIMRDPASRAISAARMNRRKYDWREGVPIWGNLDRAVLAYARSSAHALRADYARTIERMRTVFGPDEICFEFYETVFNAERLAALSGFLGVFFRPEQVKTHVYAASRQPKVTPETVSALREILADTYAYCAKAFPETERLWRI